MSWAIGVDMSTCARLLMTCCWLFTASVAGAASLELSTYLGGNGEELITGSVLGPDGSLYVTGRTTSSDLATTPGALQSAPGGGWDSFVARVSADGGELLLLTYLGGSMDDRATAIALQPDGSIVVVGSTNSPDYPGAGPGALLARKDPFVTVLKPDGTELRFTRMMRSVVTPDDTFWTTVAVGPGGTIHLLGSTTAHDLPVHRPVQGSLTGGPGAPADLYLAAFSANGSELLHATYFGGSGEEAARDLVFGPQGELIAVGATTSADHPLVGPSWPGESCSAGDCSWEAFVTVFSPQGDRVLGSRLIGGLGRDELDSVALLPNGRLRAVGLTEPHFPTRTSLPSPPTDLQLASLVDLDLDDLELTSSVRLQFRASSLSLTPGGKTAVAGRIQWPISWLEDPIDDSFGGCCDLVLMMPSPALDGIELATYLGGDDWDDMAFDNLVADSCGAVWITGLTWSTDLTTVNPVQAENGGLTDGLIMKVVVADPEAPVSSQNLRVRRVDGRLGVRLAGSPASGEFLLAQGDLDSLHELRTYSHEVVACSRVGDEVRLDLPEQSTYYLAPGRACGLLGTAGTSSLGTPRPPWVTGTGECP
ncbi:MAG: hypothetical protein AAF533_01160 [Acidobacteriota bacterium]